MYVCVFKNIIYLLSLSAAAARQQLTFQQGGGAELPQVTQSLCPLKTYQAEDF